MALAIDYNAFENLVREYYPRLMGYAGVLLDDENAKDVVQDVFTYIWDHRRRISFGDGFQTYLFRLCWSRVLDFLKKNKRNLYVGDFADVALEADIKWVESNEDALINLLSEKDLIKKALRIIEELPKNRQAVFRMSFIEHLTNSEIACRLNMPKRTVEGHLYHGLKYLRGRIKNTDLLILLAIAVTLIS